MVGLSSCLVHRNILKYEKNDNKKFNFIDSQFHIEVVKNHKFRIYPFLFVEKSGRKNNWLVTASFTTPQIEIKSITTGLIITNLKGKVLFESSGKRVDLLAFDGYNTKEFEIGTIKEELNSNNQDSLIAIYKVDFHDKLKQSKIDTCYLIFNHERRTGSFL
jgi:hypothetical protein